MANGYLRQVEFRRWAQGVDDKLGTLNSKVQLHGEMLAVVRDRQSTGDKQKGDLRHMYYSVIAGTVATVVSIVLHLLIHGSK